MSEQFEHWSCPECDCVQHIKAGGNGNTQEPCEECNVKTTPAEYLVSWEEFWAYCQKTKTGYR